MFVSPALIIPVFFIAVQQLEMNYLENWKRLKFYKRPYIDQQALKGTYWKAVIEEASLLQCHWFNN